jgi:hypothetical protein
MYKLLKEYGACCVRGDNGNDAVLDAAVSDRLLYLRSDVDESRSAAVRLKVDLLFVNLHYYFPSLSL